MSEITPEEDEFGRRHLVAKFAVTLNEETTATIKIEVPIDPLLGATMLLEIRELFDALEGFAAERALMKMGKLTTNELPKPPQRSIALTDDD